MNVENSLGSNNSFPNNHIEISCLAAYFYSQEFFWSSYIISDLDQSSIQNRIILLKSLYRLGFKQKVAKLLASDTYSELLCFEDVIKLAYLVQYYNFEINKNNVVQASAIPVGSSKFSLSIHSVLSYYKAMSARQNNRRELLLSSFDSDKNNSEALICLFMESMISFIEFQKSINLIPNVLIKASVGNRTTPSFRGTLSPLDLLVHLYFTNLSASHIFIDNFPESTLPVFKDALFCLAKKDFNKAITMLTRVVAVDTCFGLGYLYLGIAKSFIRETEDSRRNKKIALQIMGNNPITLYHIGFDYYISCNFKSGKYYLKQMYETLQTMIMPDSSANHSLDLYKSHDITFLCNFYLYFLISISEFQEAEFLIASLKSSALVDVNTILQVYLCLFSADFKEIYYTIKDTDIYSIPEKSERYLYALNIGFLQHLEDDFDRAIENYKIALSISRANQRTIQDLIHSAILSKTKGNKNDAFEYTFTLYEMLPYRERRVNFLL